MYLLKEMDRLPISFLHQVLFCPSFWRKSENQLKYRHKTSSLEPGLLRWRLKTNQKILFKNPFTQKRQKPSLKVLTCYLHKGLGSLVPSEDISTNRLLPRDCNLEERYCKKLEPRVKLWSVSDFTWPFKVGGILPIFSWVFRKPSRVVHYRLQKRRKKISL